MRTLVIPDTHFPFVSRRSLDKLYESAVRLKPDLVIQVGDLYDFYLFSKYTITTNSLTPLQEMQKGRAAAEGMWTTLRVAVGKQTTLFVQMLGNHCARPMKRLMEKLPGLQGRIKTPGLEIELNNIHKLFEFDGVKTVRGFPSEYRKEGVVYTHGFKSNLGEHAKYYGSNAVVAHTHVGGVKYYPVAGKTRWELNAGFLGDVRSLAFKYGDVATKNWTLGYGVIDEDGPRFVAL